MARTQLADIIGAIYDAALDQEDWSSVLRRVVEHTRAASGSLTLHGSNGTTLAVAATVGYDPTWLKKYTEHYHTVNVQASAVVRSVPGVPTTGEAVDPGRELLKSEYYHDFLRPQDLLHIAGGVIAKTTSSASMIAVQRSPRRPAFGARELADLRQIMKHLGQAARLHEGIRTMHAGIGALDELEAGVVGVSGSMEVIFLNHAARVIVEEKDGLDVDDSGRLTAMACKQELRCAVAAAVNAGPESAPGRECVVLIPRCSHRSPYQVSIVALPASKLAWSSREAAVVLFVADPTTSGNTADYLRRAWGLTPKEAEIAAVLIVGRDLNAACEELCISRPTARTHLAGIFSKLGVRRQGELIARLLRGQAGLVRHRDSR